MIHAEDEAAVHHHSEIMYPFDGRVVVAANVLCFALLVQVFGVGSLESNEQAAQSASNGFLQKIGCKHRIHGASRLPQTSHSAHIVEQRCCKSDVAKEVIVEKVQVLAG